MTSAQTGATSLFIRCQPGLLLATAAVLFATGAVSQSLPQGNGKAQFERVCGSCHPLTVATTQRKTEAEWGTVVTDMVSRGARGTQDDLNWIVKYLAVNFGPDRPRDNSAGGAPPPVRPASPSVPAI